MSLFFFNARYFFSKVCIIFSVFFLVSCAAERAQREGKALVSEGKIDAGLKKLEEAALLEPTSANFRASYLHTKEFVISNYLLKAEFLLKQKKTADAEHLYQEILKLEPNNNRALNALKTISINERHEKLLAEVNLDPQNKDTENVKNILRLILSENPENVQATNMLRKLEENYRKAIVQPSLKATFKKTINIEFKDVSLKQLFEVISRSSGLNLIFDKDVKLDQKTSIYLKNSDIQTALHYTLLTNQLEHQILNDNSILIFPNTTAKIKDYQEMIVKSFFLSNADAKTIANSIKSIVKSKDVVIDEKLNLVIVRDNKDAIQLIDKLVALQDIAEPEVMLDVEILEVKRTNLLALGVTWPATLNLSPLPLTSGGTLTVNDLRRNINPTSIGAAISPVIVNANKQDSDANILANPRIRARNHEKAKILIGERVPNITTTSTATGFISESITYLDVGLKLDVEPTVYLNNDVAIKIGLEVSNIVGQQQTKSGTSAYQIGTRTASTVLRLKDGETQILAGLINDEDRSNANKLPGFGDIPLLGRLFGNTNDNRLKTEIILSITPRLIRNIVRPSANATEFKAGTETTFRVSPENLSPASSGTVTEVVPSTNTADYTKSNQSTENNSTYSQNNISNGSGVVGGIPIASFAQLQWQGPLSVKRGDSVSLQLIMQSEQPVSAIPMTIGFDPKLIQIINVIEGDFLKQDVAKTSFNSNVDLNGQVQININRFGTTGAKQKSNVVTINFKPLSSTNSAAIQLLNINPLDPQGLPIIIQNPPPYTIKIE